ncbi:MAG TPA: nucleotidyltransferase family protein [Candidatus Enterenecus stercoripullorum]|nr:nucleotidyltransferase family protein [Candidatus Enterenecus stercoripullorum]
MNLVGIVAEYNPFHAGHRRHILETRRALGECAVVAVMSGNFVQRGDCAIADKWSRAAAALEGGADLVLELPTVWACASAEAFAYGAVAILKEAGVQALSFGSESGDAGSLERAAQALDSGAYRQALRTYLDRGLPFARCRHLALQELLGEEGAQCLSRPNDNLGVEYLRAAKRLGFAPWVVAVPRVGAGHDGGDHPDYPSASYLREQIYQGKLPLDNPARLGYNERGALSRLRGLEGAELEALPDCGEGLANRLYRACRQAVRLEELYELAKTKRYAHARIRRAALWACLGLRASDRPEYPPYLRVLGANQTGIGVLRKLDTALPVITKPAHGRGIPLLELESKCTDFYNLCRRTPLPCGTEWSTSPVILPGAPGDDLEGSQTP